MNNLKFVIFLSQQHMNKKKYKVCGKNYEQRLYNKGIVAIVLLIVVAGTKVPLKLINLSFSI